MHAATGDSANEPSLLPHGRRDTRRDSKQSDEVVTVSVVIPFLDAEPFLDEAVESVFEQTFQDWELLLVDDGSSDGSLAVARRWAARAPSGRVRILSHEDGATHGSSAARNLGISRATGPYVAFLDADDVWLPNKLEEQVEIMEAHPEAGVVAGATLYWESWDPDHVREDRLRHLGVPRPGLYEGHELLKSLYPLGRGMCPSMSNLMARRDLLRRVEGFELRFVGLYDDQVLLTKLYLGSAMYASRQCWDRYRRHPDSMTRAIPQEEYLRVRREFLVWLDAQLATSDVDDRGVRKAVRRAWWPYRHPQLVKVRRALGRRAGRLRWRVRRLLRRASSG